ncbi:DUF1653 domain-containing protein [Microbacterium terrisoli]|uniref:DUF1653 domain-containing protein n=1 Tax=Microbacterium terrisoli TaxID=3242192 RepID=UPI0028057489|nr:DUF1653 domain-containing protein [Microbacterium protaetiae]
MSTVQGVEPGIYEHFKGNRYEVVGVARHSETEEWFVYYRQLYGDYAFWVRPLDLFTEHVERDGYSGPRFRRVA